MTIHGFSAHRMGGIGSLVYLQLFDSPEEQSRFEELYTTYRKLMFHVAKGILGNDQDAEDAVHDAFLSIAKNFDKISTEDRHKTKVFVVIVVESRAINLYRQKKRRAASEYLEELAGLSEYLPETNGLTGCLWKLRPRYREFLLLKYEWGYDNQELAALLGISEAGVRKLEQRAKSSLETLCREEGLL